MKHLIATAALAVTVIMQPLAAYAEGCTIYQHRDFQGSSWWFANGDRMIMIDSPYGEDMGCTSGGQSCGTTYYRASWNDELSSFDVDPGCHIRMWEHVNEGGAHWYDNEGYSYVGGGWNDAVSEVYCYCD